MQINTKEELNNLVKKVIENKIEITDKKELFYIIKNKIAELFLKEGDIPPSFYIKLYNFFYEEKLDVQNDDIFRKNIEVLENYYNQATIEEKYLLNNVLFILQFFENGVDAVSEYIKRGLVFHTHKMIDNKEGQLFPKFFKNIKISDELIINIVKEFITIEKFFSLDKDSQRALFSNLLAVLWNMPLMYGNKIWLTIFDDLVILLDECIKRELIEEQMYIHFCAYHIYGNNVQTIKEWEVFNQKVEKPASKFYKKWGEIQKLKPCKKEFSKGKKKIGFLFDRIVVNSPFMVEYSLFKALLNNKEFNKEYEIYVYSMNYIDKNMERKNVINALKALGIKFFSPEEYFIKDGFYYSHLAKALLLREQIINDEIDYLIGGFGYDIPNFIFSNRSAPKQIFWSHGNCTSEIENIDIRISHFEQECKNYEWKIFNVPMAEEFLVGSEEEKKEAEKLKESLLEKFGEDTVILGTIGRLVKIESVEYIKVLSEIMKQNPNTIYLACGDGNQEKVEQLMTKYEIDLKRVIFTGQVNPHMYGWVIDIWPDSFPLRQGQSKNEYSAKGGIVVYMNEYLNDTIRNWYKDFEIKPYANSVKEYVEIINEFINNREKREKLSKFNKSIFNDNFTNFIEIINE